MWDKLDSRYKSASNVKEVNLLTTLIDTRYQASVDLSDYIVELETYFNRQDIMGVPVSEEKQVAILLVSETHEESLEITGVALKTVDGEKATWDSLCSCLLG